MEECTGGGDSPKSIHVIVIAIPTVCAISYIVAISVIILGVVEINYFTGAFLYYSAAGLGLFGYPITLRGFWDEVKRVWRTPPEETPTQRLPMC